MGTWIGKSSGPVHTGTGNVVVNGKTVTDSDGKVVGGNGETVEVKPNGDVYVDGVKQ